MLKKRADWRKYHDNYKEYRKAYCAWNRMVRTGRNISLDDYFKNGDRVQYVKDMNRPRKQSKKPKSKSHWARKRYLKIGLATPKWINIDEMLEIYNNKPAGHHVDHIIPINGKNVCGLHVPWNLQYLKASDNIKKGNK